MDKVQKYNSFNTNTPSSESYRNHTVLKYTSDSLYLLIFSLLSVAKENLFESPMLYIIRRHLKRILHRKKKAPSHTKQLLIFTLSNSRYILILTEIPTETTIFFCRFHIHNVDWLTSFVIECRMVMKCRLGEVMGTFRNQN
jgi:hypothetical protein